MQKKPKDVDFSILLEFFENNDFCDFYSSFSSPEKNSRFLKVSPVWDSFQWVLYGGMPEGIFVFFFFEKPVLFCQKIFLDQLFVLSGAIYLEIDDPEGILKKKWKLQILEAKNVRKIT